MIEQSPADEHMKPPSKKDSPQEAPPILNDTPDKRSSFLEYPMHVGSAPIVKIDGNATAKAGLQAMHHQTHTQLNQIREQMELLAVQARKIQERIEVSEKIYRAKCSFKPQINQTYYLYSSGMESPPYVLSLIGPNEWGRSKSYPQFIASVRLMGDHTWEVINSEASIL